MLSVPDKSDMQNAIMLSVSNKSDMLNVIMLSVSNNSCHYAECLK